MDEEVGSSLRCREVFGRLRRCPVVSGTERDGKRGERNEFCIERRMLTDRRRKREDRKREVYVFAEVAS